MSSSISTALIFDVETTGNNYALDQIIELSVQCGLASGSELKCWRFKPSVPISAEAQSVHGISLDDLKDCPPFAAHMPEILELFSGAELLVGYNIEFDLNFLRNECKRCGRDLDTGSKLLIDPLALWRKLEPRRLQDAYKRFVGAELTGAHSAAVDVTATAAVLAGMVDAFKLPSGNWKEIAQLCGLEQKNWIGPTYHFQWKGDIPVFGFGKHRNRPLADVAREESGGYFEWLTRSDFPPHVKEIAQVAQGKSIEELKSWLQRTYSPTPK